MTYDTSSAVLDCDSPSSVALSPENGAASTAAKDSYRQPSRDTTKSAKIMIVDDEPINIKVVQKYLQGHGYTHFQTTTDSTVALEMALSECPDIILLDIMMPDVSGIEILQQARDTYELHRIPIVILTAVGDARVKQKALELGATDFLTKPVEDVDLLDAVHRALAKDRSLRSGRRKNQEVQQRLEALTPREREVFALIVTGMLNKEVGEQMGISEKTVKHHMTNIMGKLDARNRVEAALMVRRHRSRGQRSTSRRWPEE